MVNSFKISKLEKEKSFEFPVTPLNQKLDNSRFKNEFEDQHKSSSDEY